MKLSFFAAVGAVLLCVTSARANFIAFYTSNAGTVFNYTLRFTADQPGEVLRSGDTVTLYDLGVSADIVSVTPPSSPADVFSVSQQSIGITPTVLAGAAGLLDSPNLQNITFTYTGPNLAAPQDFTGVSLTMGNAYIHSALIVGRVVGATEISFPLSTDSTFHQDVSSRAVLLPAPLGCGCQNTPEPGSLAVMGLGAAGPLARWRKAGSAGGASSI